ncbi:hypothetical protein A8F94_21305 [Bacillus sp. FJAT-27225]|uniref:SWIM zinc finger family protein n=1 Tax=Bacillus sp. FJAT-27225 TaxID=1743144 RepID=UPI00080C2FCD|nr:SWIM zinc finger family protein [Bacillus sp. FJAT-27225]OCA82442.1 hypothetical protein A8F94_21305 [Bacillus sp. FJAT-27225]
MRNEGLEITSEKLRDMLSPHSEEDARLMQKGMMLYRQGMVSQLRMDEETVTATVQDVVPVRVTLELLFPEMNECSCPGHGLCRHQLAVFFTAYSRTDSVAEWIEDWRYPVREKRAATAWGMQRARDLIKANGALKQDYPAWIESFTENFGSIMRAKKNVNPYVVSELFGVYWRRIKADSPRGEEWSLLYQLSANVFSFAELARFSREVGHTDEMVNRYYRHLFTDLGNEASSIAARLGHRAKPLGFDPFLQKLREDTRVLLTDVPLLRYERTFIYMGIWTGLFKKKEWLEEELGKLEELIESGENGLPVVIAAAHLNFLLKEDALVLGHLSILKEKEASPFLLHWIDEMNAYEEWNRVGPYLDMIIQKLKGVLSSIQGYQGRSQIARSVVESALPYVEETGRSDVLERLLHQALPYTYYEYGSLLFERGDYAKWAELQSYMGYQYADLPSARLKVLEKEMPEAVMSILHQSAAKQIAAKNRPGYKQAVRMLKKLRTLYKKQKRLDEWNAFFEELLERTKRLRAFHEECQRSKLIDVQ